MKTIKTLLTSLFLFVGLAAQAQVIVIEKTDGTKDEYQLYEVDSVAYVPKMFKYFKGKAIETDFTTEKMTERITNSTTIATTRPTEINWPSSSSLFEWMVYIYPEEWGTISGLTNKSDNKPIAFYRAYDLEISNPDGYKIIAISHAKNFTETTSIITWENPTYYYYIGPTKPTISNIETIATPIQSIDDINTTKIYSTDDALYILIPKFMWAPNLPKVYMTNGGGGVMYDWMDGSKYDSDYMEFITYKNIEYIVITTDLQPNGDLKFVIVK